MASPCRIVVMASGSGSNFQALLDAVDITLHHGATALTYPEVLAPPAARAA